MVSSSLVLGSQKEAHKQQSPSSPSPPPHNLLISMDEPDVQ